MIDNARALPWRSPPGSAAARPLCRLAERGDAAANDGRDGEAALPALHRALADASRRSPPRPTRRCSSEWAGLGYYARARNLIACARQWRRWAAFRATEAELRKLPGLGRLYRRGHRRDCLRRAGGGRRHQRRPGGRPLPWHRAPLDRVPRRNPETRRGDDPADRPGDFAQAMMDLGATICRPKNPDCPACPLAERLRGALPAERRKPSRRPSRRRARPHRHGIAWWIERERRGLAGPPPGQGHARRHGRAAWRRSGATQPPAAPAIATVSHGFTHFTLDLHVVDRVPSPSAKAGGSRSIGSTKPACRRSIAKAVDAMLARKDSPLPPDPFFAGGGLDRADPSARRPGGDRRPAAAMPRPAQLVWDNGAPAIDERGKLRGEPVAGDPPLFLGLSTAQLRASRPCPTAMCPVDARAHFQLLALLDASEAPIFAAALSLANWHRRHRLLLGLRPADRAQPRRLVARLRHLRRRTLSARRSGGDHAGRA